MMVVLVRQIQDHFLHPNKNSADIPDNVAREDRLIVAVRT